MDEQQLESPVATICQENPAEIVSGATIDSTIKQISTINSSKTELEVCVAGRLKNFLTNWNKITSDNFVLQAVKGFQITFKRRPCQLSAPPGRDWTHEEVISLRTEVNDLIIMGAISHCERKKGQFLSSFFIVDRKNKSKRFIFYLKALNEFAEVPHFKIEDIRTACKLITQNCFMANLDFKNAYFLVPVDEKFRKFLRFSFENITFRS